MTEYIERETAIAWFMPYAHVGESIDGDVVISDIKGMKAADVAPVRHGRWKRSGALLECQLCGEIYSQLSGNAGKSWNYCPNCGADMRGSNDE